jgi:uncharacterized membrane protein
MSIETITDFLANYFFSGYTVFNTLIYGIILLFALYGIIKLFEYLKIKPTDLIFPLIPFIFFGSGIRALVDNGILPYNWALITPGIYIIVGVSAIATLIFSFYLQKWKGINFKYTIFIIGLIIAIPVLINFTHLNLIAVFQVLAVWGGFTLLFFILGKFFSLFDTALENGKINLFIISAHLFDASTTFMAVDYYGYFEQHVLPNVIYNLSGTAITMFPLKIIVISFGLYLVDKYIDDELIAGVLKLSIFILGLAPGIRNFLSLAMGTYI